MFCFLCGFATVGLTLLAYWHLCKYAANQLILWSGAEISEQHMARYVVDICQVMKLANFYYSMLNMTCGLHFQFCKEHMQVEVCMVIAGSLEVSFEEAFPSFVC